MADVDARTGPGANRPLSPHLSIYRPIVTMVMSILHRITGVANFAGIVLVVWWLVAAASGPGAYAVAAGFLGSWLGILILFGFTWSVTHHMLGGIRHLIWDTGHGFEERPRRALAWATIIGSLTLTVLVWIVGLAV